MNFVFSNIVFPKKGNVRVYIAKIHGIGLARSNYLCDLIGLSASCDFSEINKYHFSLLTYLIKNYYGIDLLLKRARFNRIKSFLSVRSYGSLRLQAGLPLRGQRTHTNARTAKLFKVGNIKDKD